MGDLEEATILIVEDDPGMRAHLERAVGATAGLRLLGSAGSLQEGQAALRKEAPTALLTDLGLPDGSGLELIRETREQAPETLCMVVTVMADERTVVKAIEAGASGYLLKDGTHDEIGASLLEMLEGGSPISSRIARHLLRRFRPEPAPEAAHGDGQEPSLASPSPSLTARETEVLQLIAKGFSFSEIGDLLGISTHTVTTHVRKIYGKLEVRSRGAAVYEAVSLGIIEMDR